jgi:hypothetical protein
MGDPKAAVRVLAKVEAGSIGPDEYAVGITVRPESHMDPLSDDSRIFQGLSFAEAHWVAAVLASTSEDAADADGLLFDLRVPVDLTWRDIELAPEVIEWAGLRSAPLVPWLPADLAPGRQYAIATYTLDCGHQALELLRQDPDSVPFWMLVDSVDHLAARDARSLSRLLLTATTLDEASALIEQGKSNLAMDVDDDHDDDHDEDDD